MYKLRTEAPDRSSPRIPSVGSRSRWRVVVVRAAKYQQEGWMGNLLQFMKHEARWEAAGAKMVTDLLSSVDATDFSILLP